MKERYTDSFLHVTEQQLFVSRISIPFLFLKRKVGIRSASNVFLPRMSNFSHETTGSQNKHTSLKDGLDLPELGVSVAFKAIYLSSLPLFM